MSQALKHGSRGQAVRVLQQQLNQRGATLAVDGAFGDSAESAVRAFQQSVGMVPDGVAGYKTQAVLGGADPARFLRLRDLQAAATRLGVPLASVLAVNEVESAGAGFLDNGKAAILYERHIMYQRLALPVTPTMTKRRCRHAPTNSQPPTPCWSTRNPAATSAAAASTSVSPRRECSTPSPPTNPPAGVPSR